ncbi:hypothetical protein [Vibrio genomosp. F10]|uniref:hypothetical protein n=1 Tax=Vibrio genomosp. F10 TaxID=723171 RepID=UPI00035DDB8B|nr:hypothetical protein [Vibrio genomosp. F10]OEF06542.1 hypothetical protein A1QK_08045 [Vibrio genomosp. F10 str. 9ZD137]
MNLRLLSIAAMLALFSHGSLANESYEIDDCTVKVIKNQNDITLYSLSNPQKIRIQNNYVYFFSRGTNAHTDALIVPNNKFAQRIAEAFVKCSEQS